MGDDPVFPPELFAIIIGALAGDLETLRSCALVSSTFYCLARVSRLQVGPLVDQEHNLAQLCEVHRLLQRVWNLFASASVGQSLPIDGSGFFLPWLELSHANRHSIQAILPTLTCLELVNISEFPLALLSHCSSLRSLTLDDVLSAASLGASVDTDSCSSIHLRHLVLRVRATVLHELVDWFTNPESPFDISSLRSLEYRADNQRDHLPIQRLLHTASQSLQYLCIQNHECCLSSRSPRVRLATDAKTVTHELNLCQLAHLRTLALEIYLDNSEADNHQCLLSLRNFVFPPTQQAHIALVLDITTQEELRLTDIMLPFETVTVILATWHPEHGKKEKLMDVRDEFVRAMPLLASKPGRADRLRILESIPVQ
ncbi:hypothetical protein C8R45DRAFT_1095569 [Mycena sanguinolenta]|nr:hypothetical protein C8R45DRAFT_1095569 [Mycena sanguinolenta]